MTNKHTPLHNNHLASGGRMVSFAGWDMPIQYEGILDEARAVRNRSGIFDVSHMGRLFISGRQSPAMLEWVLTNTVNDLLLYQARYTLLCTGNGGILDDGIVYRLGETSFMLVVNAANRAKVLDWLDEWKPTFPSIEIEDRTEATAMIAFQGPAVDHLLRTLAGIQLSDVRPFRFREIVVGGVPILMATTGYTGESGVEFIIDSNHASSLWVKLLSIGATPCGLGARDLLRLEAGLLLHGTDMDISVNPLEAGLERFARIDRVDYCGVTALRTAKQSGLSRQLVGFETVERTIPRRDYSLVDGHLSVGRVTSGTYSPTLDRCIGLGYVSPAYANPGTILGIEARGKTVKAEVVTLPFYSRRKHQ